MAEWKRKMMVKGGGKMELWSRYFHQMLALQDSTVKCGPVKVKVKSEKSESEKWSRYFHQMLALQDSTLKSGQVKVKSESEKMKVKSGRGTSTRCSS